MSEPLLSAADLTIRFTNSSGQHRTLLTGVDLTVAAGETIGVVGESGSGKSMMAKAIMRLLPPGVHASGAVHFEHCGDLLTRSERQMTAIRGGRVALMYQDPFTMLNPLLRCGDHIAEGLRARPRATRPTKSDARHQALQRLSEVGITDPSIADRYPFQLSGGMRQRVALAAALARDPQLLIADEPSTALDVTTQAEILDLLHRVQRQRDMGLILITHDLRVAFSVSDRIYVLYAGSVLETGPAKQIEQLPLHPYTLGLIRSEPPVDRRLGELITIEGSVPRPQDVATQCAFASRCQWSAPACVAERPPLVPVGPGRRSACIRLDDIASELRSSRLEAATDKSEASAADDEAHQPSGGALVQVRELVKIFGGARGGEVRALGGVSIDVGRDESVGLVGESGSGKTTLGRCLVGLETPSSGSITIDGVAAARPSSLSNRDRAALRRSVQIVFQDPYSSLDPRQTVGAALTETLRVNDITDRLRWRVDELLETVGLPPGYASRLPAALSGGERQRVAIARALAVDPRLIVCDEPVSALDVSVQAQILKLFRELRERKRLSYLFITHDLAVVRQVVERVYVLYRGELVEQGRVDDVLDHPQHPYTRRLVASIPGRSESVESSCAATDLDTDLPATH